MITIIQIIFLKKKKIIKSNYKRKKKHNIKISIFENFLLENLDKKPKKRKFIYPKDEPDEDNDNQTNKNLEKKEKRLV